VSIFDSWPFGPRDPQARAELDARLAAVDREIDADEQAARRAAMTRHPSSWTPTADPAAPVSLTGCTCESCMAAAQAVADYWRERGEAFRSLRDAVSSVRFDGQLTADDRAFLRENQVAL